MAQPAFQFDGTAVRQRTLRKKSPVASSVQVAKQCSDLFEFPGRQTVVCTAVPAWFEFWWDPIKV